VATGGVTTSITKASVISFLDEEHNLLSAFFQVTTQKLKINFLELH